ncbi:MAG: hypothetical protein AVDCRST_MAG40-1324 [uncultured Gemmatimonadaceae bacterium]|uniref:DUF4230 domain-containing protein n=1 Tax=uncultured Gemmatimonadaceae bacterium TaxID=246130 RepID=A0A6J4KXE1_9BACT|nr:MAG: hypothetical protein AVDCRST_MAG40-1324 [uncultured Gemmatimonadaceae bacterium]
MRPRLRPWLVPAIATLVVLALGARDRVRDRAAAVLAPRPAVITQALVVERVRAVAKLVSSETTVRDVVTYEQTNRLGSTKRALVVVTGRLLAGVDLARQPPTVRIDSVARRIEVVLPRAELISVEITEMRTYDETSGLLNPFRPEDRDEILQLVRRRLAAAGTEVGVVEHANRSAVQMLTTLLGVDGYTADVRVGSAVTRGPG